jgi:hypothetical protein
MVHRNRLTNRRQSVTKDNKEILVARENARVVAVAEVAKPVDRWSINTSSGEANG